MADVYRGHDPQFDRDVAIKLIHPQFAERFSHELRAVARLRHSNIIHVFDFDLSGGQPYMVMELASGPTLKDRLKALRDVGGQMMLLEVVRIATAIASVLDHAHAQGLIHGDVRPSNILFTPSGEPLLADFGLAQISGQAPQNSDGSASGASAYSAPEQAQGSPSPSSDLYSFAVVVCEMLAGDSAIDSILKQQERPPAPHVMRADIPPAVDAVFQQALAKSPADRYPTAAAFVAALDGALHTQSAPAPNAEPITNDAKTVHDARIPAPAPEAHAHRPSPPEAAVAPTASHSEHSTQDPALAAPSPVSGLPSAVAKPSLLHRTVELLGSAALVVAPLIGREKVPVSTHADDRRTALASLMAILGIFLAVLQFVSNAFDLVTRTVAPLFRVLPIVIVAALALGALAAIGLMRHSTTPRHRRIAAQLLVVIVLGAAGWGSWQAYDRTRPPAGPIVVIADFEPCTNCQAIEFGQRIYARVKVETDRLHLSNLEVRHVLETYPDAETARARRGL
jgi:serine/threonine-protein kinase